MRISDWSSDVCSSDLHVGVTMPLHRLERVARRRTLIAIVDDQRAAALTGDSSGKIRCNGDAGGCGFDDRAKRATAKCRRDRWIGAGRPGAGHEDFALKPDRKSAG